MGQARSDARRLWWWAALAAGLVMVDQVVKALVVAQRPAVDLGILTIRMVSNTGASFGMLQGTSMLLFWVSVIALGALLFWLERLPWRARIFALLAGSGIVGNAIDRAVRGFVVDYIDLGWWPVFNLADCLIVCGLSLVAWELWQEEKGVKSDRRK